MEENGFRWALWSWRQLKIIRKRKGSGPQWGLLYARHGPDTLDALASRCCILTLQMRKQAQKDEGACLGSHSQLVVVGLAIRPRSEDLETCLGFTVDNWEVVRSQDPKFFQQRAGGKGSPASQAVL